MLNQKENVILKTLYNSKEAYTTSKEIATVLEVSDRTARKYINQLIETIDNKIAEIHAIPGYGYNLEIKDERSIKRLLYKDKLNFPDIESKENLYSNSISRQYYILNQLFFSKNRVTEESLSEDLYVSQATVAKDLLKINQQLKKYNLNLSEKNTTLNIKGNEIDKRHFIMQNFFADRLKNNLQSMEEITKFLPHISVEEILLIVLDETRNSCLDLTDVIMFNIAIHIALALRRIQDGKEITDMYDEVNISSTEITVAKAIISRVEQSTGIKLPSEEIKNIALHFKLKINELSNKDDQEKNKRIEQELKIVLRQIDKEYNFSLSSDDILIQGLTAHFTPLLMRVETDKTLKNPLTKQVKSNFSEAYEITKNYFSQMDSLQETKISEDEWAYIALHVIAALEREYSLQKKKVLVVCATGMGSSQMIKVRIENEFGNKLVIHDVISYYQISEERFNDVDFVISTIDLSNTVFNKLILHVSVLLTPEDCEKINKLISNKSSITTDTINISLDRNNLSKVISKYFRPELFSTKKNISTKEEVISQLVKVAVKYDPSINKTFLEGQLKLRESFGSVLFTKTLAIPHPIEGVAEESKAAIILTPEGIKWSEDASEVLMTILLLPDRYGGEDITELSKILTTLIEKPDKIELLSKVESFSEFIDNFKLIYELRETDE